MSGGVDAAGRLPEHFRPDLEGLRAVAVVLVLLFHAGVPGFDGGFIGVDVFFVLSGFLITGLLLREIGATDRISLRDFYARRARRLLPMSAVVLVAILVGSALVLNLRQLESVGTDAASAALYVSNLRFGAVANDYFAASELKSPVLHFWSLSVEEQFYLAWPAIVLVVWRLRRSRQALLAAVAALSLVSFIACVLLTERSPSWAFYLLPTRAWELGAGAIIALLPGLGRLSGRARLPMALVGLGLIVLGAVLLQPGATFPGAWALVPVAGAALVIIAGTDGLLTAPSRMLGMAAPRYLGRISYSVYLWHWPMLVLAGAAFGPLSLPVAVAIAAASIPLGALTQHLVERPFREGRWIGRRPGRNLVQAAVITLVMAGLGIGTAAVAQDRIGAIFAGLTPSPRDFDRGLRGWCFSVAEVRDDDQCVLGDPTGDRTMVIYGDSHADHWTPAFDAIARAHGMRLVALARPSCSAVIVDFVRPALGAVDPECAEWRDAALDRIAGESPELVVLAQAMRLGLYQDGVPTTDRPTVIGLWQEGLREVLTRIVAPSTVVLSAGLVLPFNGPDCLVEHGGDAAACTQPVAPWVREFHDAERAVTDALGGRYVDTTAWICPDDACPAVIGDHVVYRDEAHLTAPFVLTLTDRLAAAIGLG